MKKFNYKNTVFIILLIIGAVFLQNQSQWTLLNPMEALTYSDIVYGTLDKDGNRIIIDSSGHRIVKVDKQGHVLTIINGGKDTAKQFNEAKKILTDNEGNIYVQSIVKEAGGFRIQKEAIQKFSESGKFLGTITSVEYEEPLLVENIRTLYLLNGEFGYITIHESGFSLYDEKATLVSEKPLETALLRVVSFAVDPNTGEIYYATKQGSILKYVNGSSEVIYDAGKETSLSIPRELSISSSGELYFTDIGQRTVSILDEKGNAIPLIYDGEVGIDTQDKAIYYYMNGLNGVIAVTTEYIAVAEDGETLYETGGTYRGMALLMILVSWVVILAMAAIGLYFIIRLLLIIIRKGTRLFKTTMSIVGAVIVVAGVLLLIVLPDFQSRLMDSELNRAKAISKATTMMLPIDSFIALDKPSDFMGPDYLQVKKVLNDIFLSNTEGLSDFYCVLYSIQNNQITCTYSLQEDTGAVYPYDWAYEGSDEQEIITTGEGKVYEGLSSSEGSFLFILNPIFDEKGNAVGLIEVGKDLNSFNEQTNKMVLDLFLNVFAMTIVVVLLGLEVLIFLKGRQEFSFRRKESKIANTGMRMPNDLLRILVFGVFFITNMTTSFLPLYAMKIASNIPGITIPKEVMAAIPISAEVVFGAIFSIYGNVIIRRIGQKKAAILGSLLFSVGLFVRFIPNIWILTLGNSIMGSGWGIILLIVNSLIAVGTDEEKDKGFAGYSAAALNGVNCGIVFGGFLVNWLDYSMIFLFAVLLSFTLLAHVIVYFRKDIIIEDESDEIIQNPINLWQFIKSKGIIKFYLMIVIPIIACGYFLNFMFPILGAEYGLSETNVGYAYLINGLCVICLSNLLTDYFSKKVKKEYSLVFASLIYALAFIWVANYQNIQSLIVALVLLGIADSFGLPLQTSYYTDLEGVKKYGYDKAIGIYSLFENIAQAGGSFIFSYVLLVGVSNGLYLVVMILTVLAGGFAILYGIELRNKVKRTQTE